MTTMRAVDAVDIAQGMSEVEVHGCLAMCAGITKVLAEAEAIAEEIGGSSPVPAGAESTGPPFVVKSL